LEHVAVIFGCTSDQTEKGRGIIVFLSKAVREKLLLLSIFINMNPFGLDTE
jgi:hypothetical protein